MSNSNGEFQMYTNDEKNVYVKDGKLYIQPTLTVDDPRFSSPDFLYKGEIDMYKEFGTCTWGGDGCKRSGTWGILPPVMSGRIHSKPTLKFGTMEIRARVPRGDWLWPAIWLMPKNSVYGGWPQSGEIDVMESIGNEGDGGIKSVSSTLPWGPYGQN